MTEFCLSIRVFLGRRAMSCCSHCGEQRAALKRCSRCKHASYCGAECQNAAWKGHKKTCATLDDVFDKVNAAGFADDWREVLKWEGRMEEMMENRSDAGCNAILALFVHAHGEAFNSTGSKDDALSIVRLQTQNVEVLGKMQRFRDQGVALCIVAEQLLFLGKQQEAEGYFLRARKSENGEASLTKGLCLCFPFIGEAGPCFSTPLGLYSRPVSEFYSSPSSGRGGSL